MKENARQGFWNRATAPLGYKLVEAEKRGDKIKKLDIDPVEAETARLIFKRYLYGDGTSCALGVKQAAVPANPEADLRAIAPQAPGLGVVKSACRWSS